MRYYTASQPSGVYAGKMWKARYESERRWWLLWFGVHVDPKYCTKNYREIIVV